MEHPLSGAVGLRTRIVALTFALAATFALETRAKAQEDTVLRAMIAEMNRGQAQLGGGEFQAPYFLAMTVKETRRDRLSARGGALVTDASERSRHAVVDVRVGDYGFDSSEDAEQFWGDDLDYEASAQMPIEDNEHALRHALWLLTDLRYKQATAAYLRLKGQSVFKPPEDAKQLSHSSAPAVRQFDPISEIQLDRLRLRPVVKRLSTRISNHPVVFDGHVELSVTQTIRWITNTEGARLRTVRTLFGFHATALSRAEDGMLIEHSVNRYGPSLEALGDAALLDAAVAHMLAELRALTVAPELGPYSGPAL